MIPRVADIIAELAALYARQAELTAELSRVLREAPVPTPARTANALPEYLTTREAAALLGVSVRTLEGLRATGEGPRYVRVGRAVRYPRNMLKAIAGHPAARTERDGA
jgi:excisionase family DNA binding protein